MIRTLADIARDPKRSPLLAGGIILIAFGMYGMLFLSAHPSALRLLSLSYMGVSVVVGAWLYISSPALYLGFIWWLWFLSPFVRRIIDYHLGFFTPPSGAFSLLAPYAATLVILIDLPRYGRMLTRRLGVPLLICFMAVLYGYLVGMTKVEPFRATTVLLDWICPLLMALFILARWRQYPRLRSVFRTAFTWGVLIIGSYGVYQFFAAPPWDVLWMEGSRMLSAGKPEPLGIRVFSMLDSPGPFAMIMMAGLILLFDSKGPVGRVAAIPGYLAFLLSLVRGAWGGWVLALSYSLLRLQNASRGRVFAMLALVACLTIPLALSGDIGDRTGARMETFSNLEEDGSLQERQHMYGYMLTQLLFNPIGQGMGARTFDSDFVTIIYQLGWVGGFAYLGALITILITVLRDTPPSDRFAILVSGIALAYFALMLMGPQVVGAKGCLFWSCIAFAVTSRQYHSEHDSDEEEHNTSLEPAPSSASQTSASR
ncbi:hypothetical protein CRI93_00520 [Longimonas halophila]|uniref:Glucose-6-phosphate isomerase n=1 Tax=Longimonas halophila TaxID=1469170 RepID=A0A2H3NPX5_9BACT|nr:hypothetical protein [Longimonas halophila]PEN09247.1 hypothetical protein CRI93_00520 [Longimonas halophila]